ncbi:MAG: aspartoacylase [Prochlorococcus sp. SP3034]|nr:aspartoacylase [Prochlorococcus sp. SP3034]|tara:strand:- start:441 stop:1337 length:897 start_codon:yes stop_codon:yes gene_type:complete
MTEKRLLIVSGTHGNEINPIWAVEKFKKSINFECKDRNLEFILGNPNACEKGLRYIDVDLNRSFNVERTKSNENLYEIKRAEFLLNNFGINSSQPYHSVIDLHTTTSCMGTSIVMYGRREKDFCLAAILQNKFGLPIYLHEKDHKQTGFLVEAWPSGLVLEIGPVAQNHYNPEIVDRFVLILNFLKELFDNFKTSQINLPEEITVFVHQYSIDYPRDKDYKINALIHPQRINKDWCLLNVGEPLFKDISGENIIYKGSGPVYPVFIGEAAYREKRIAMSFTEKEIIKCSENWKKSFLN